MGTTEATDDSCASISLAQLTETVNLAEANASEEDKIKAMMLQCGREYDPIGSVKKPLGPPPPSYTCFRCGVPGHHIKSCPTNGDKNFECGRRIRRSTGIPTSFLTEVKDAHTKGAMLTSTGKYAIPTLDAEAYGIGKKEKPPFLPDEQSSLSSSSSSSSPEEENPVPEELLCLICKDIMVDAAIIPCCGNSYCDECIRTALLESDEHRCPTCRQNDVSPDALTANQCLRQAVKNFGNGTGYTKGPGKRFPPPPPPIPPPRPLIQRSRQPLVGTRVGRQQDPLRIPVTSSSALPAPSVSLLISSPPPLAPSLPGTASSVPAPVPDLTATVSVAVHSEKSDGPLRDSADQLSPAAAVEPEHSKGASWVATAALTEEKGHEVPVLATPSRLAQSSLQGQGIPTTGPVSQNAAAPAGGGPPGWGHFRELGYPVPPPQPVRRGEGSCYRSTERHRPQHSPRSQRAQGPSLAATPVSVPLPPGVPPPHFSPGFPPEQPPTSGYSVPCPGFPPAPATLWKPLVWSSGVQTAHPNPMPPTPTRLLSREEFYREQRRLREEEKKKSRLDEFTNGFLEALSGCEKIQRKPGHSFSRSKSPWTGSSDSRSPFASSSKSRSGSTRSSSSSGSCSRPHSGFSSPSPRYPRRGRGESRPHGSGARSRRCHGSRSRSPPHRRYRSRSRSPQRRSTPCDIQTY
ncbi:E3 ubiquitin-protein ligase RBBP6-like [Peromyscus californicus insignis]|uniref:E3 ubiquitin-protein ligase RBBP6-like n=1 Tax=Peromyscus californicus insignis TaxID=564181 RepID=UPI0022A7FEE0|nr:E3 ubiquitin-protein ligase RBBP6-like [Peromyscus californicus insignis]